MSLQEIKVSYEPTPNPQSMKFNFDRKVCDGQQQFDGPEGSEASPLAHKLFGFPWAESVYVDQNFVTITKQEWVEWDIIATPLAQLIKDHIDEGGAVLLGKDEIPQSAQTQNSNNSSTEINEEDSEQVQLIKKVLNEEIRPAVAMDGGDIAFDRYENNIVYVYLRGACNGCPSAAMTLKQGIEVRLIEALPEIKEVVSL